MKEEGVIQGSGTVSINSLPESWGAYNEENGEELAQRAAEILAAWVEATFPGVTALVDPYAAPWSLSDDDIKSEVRDFVNDRFTDALEEADREASLTPSPASPLR